MGRRIWAATAAGLVALTASNCASVPVRVPAGPWAADPESPSAFADATASCRGVRTFSAEVAVAGHAGGSRIRGRLLVGFERPGRVRIEGVAPFGAPIFILAARDNRGSLVLPRERGVVADADVGDLVEALTGVSRSADDLLALLSGCVVSDPSAAPGSRNGSGWLSVPIGDAVSAFLRRDGRTWYLRAARRAGTAPEESSWLVEYGDFVSGFPATIRLREGGAVNSDGQASADLTLRVSQRDVNVPMDPSAFDVRIPAGAQRMSLDELRQRGPLADSDVRTGRKR